MALPETGGSDLALTVDLYQLTMANVFFELGRHEPATYELVVSPMPSHRNFLVAAGVDDAISAISELKFDRAAIRYLESLELLHPEFLTYLSSFRFEGDLRAVREGTAFFGGEPIVSVAAPLPQVQLIETLLMNVVGFQTAIASKAARVAVAAQGRVFVDFSARRTHGHEAALKAARAAYVGGADGTSLLLAGATYRIPVSGTMAHSFVMAFGNEDEAFEAFARTFPKHAVLLLDTYEVEQGVAAAVRTATELQRKGIEVQGVRLDSYELARHTIQIRQTLDEAGLHGVRIYLSGDLDEHRVEDVIRRGLPVDGFGVGGRMGTSADLPNLGLRFNLVDLNGSPISGAPAGRPILPGTKQVWRSSAGDLITLADEEVDGARPLLVNVMSNGLRTDIPESLDDIQKRTMNEVADLPDAVKALVPANPPYPIGISTQLVSLMTTADLDAERSMRLITGNPAWTTSSLNPLTGGSH